MDTVLGAAAVLTEVEGEANLLLLVSRKIWRGWSDQFDYRRGGSWVVGLDRGARG